MRASLRAGRVRMMPRDGGNILRLDCGLVEQLIEFARRELAAPAIRNANSASGCFELAGFGDRDHRIDSVRLAAFTVFRPMYREDRHSSRALRRCGDLNFDGDFDFEFRSSSNASRHGISP